MVIGCMVALVSDADGAKEMRFLKQLHFTKFEERGNLKKAGCQATIYLR